MQRATPFLRRQIGARVRLRRVPELRFEFDQSVQHQDRVEQILLELQAEREARGETAPAAEPGAAADAPDSGAPDAVTGSPKSSADTPSGD